MSNLARYFEVPVSDFLEPIEIDTTKSALDKPPKSLMCSRVTLCLNIKNKLCINSIENDLSSLNYSFKRMAYDLMVEIVGDIHGCDAIEKTRRLILRIIFKWGVNVRIGVSLNYYDNKKSSSNNLVPDRIFILDAMLTALKRVPWGGVIANNEALKTSYFNSSLSKHFFNNVIHDWFLIDLKGSYLDEPVGRYWEINQLNYFLGSKTIEKNGKPVYIHGPAGIGKSHLAKYIYCSHPNIKSAFYFEPGDGENSHYLSVCRNFFRALLTFNDHSDEESIAQKILQLNMPSQPKIWLFDYLFDSSSSLVSVYPGWHRNCGVILQILLSEYARRNESSIFIDNIHIVNNSSENFLPVLVECIKSFSISLILIGRNIGSLKYVPRWLDDAHVIQLRELNHDQLKCIGGDILKLRGWNDVADQVLVRAGGNPRALKQLLLSSKPATEIPSFIISEISQLFSSLKAIEKTGVKVASLLLDSFSIEEFNYCFSRLFKDKSGNTLHSLIAHGLLTIAGDKFQFNNPIARQVILLTMSPAEKNRVLSTCGITVRGEVLALNY